MAGSKQLSVILVKQETVSGTDAAPTNTANAQAIRVSGLSVKIEQRTAKRDVISGSFEAEDELPYARRGKVSFSVELQASGTLGTAPAWGAALKLCGFNETVTATTRVDYLPASVSLPTGTIWAYYNGRLIKLNYCVGTVKASLAVGQVPSLDFEFTGLVTSVAAGAAPTPTLTSWIRAEAVGPAGSAQMLIGATTYSAGAITGGTVMNWKSIEIDVGNDVQDVELVSQETVGIYGRSPKAAIKADFGAAAHAAFVADMYAGTPRAFGVIHGSTAGKKVGIYAPVGVITDMGDEEEGPVLIDSMGMTLRPSSGNDSLRIFCV